MGTPSDVTNLLREASRADTPLARQQELVAAAEQVRGEMTAQANAARNVDLSNAIVRDHLTPARVHEHHTAATDWVGDLDTSGGSNVEQEMTAQGSLWYGRLHTAVKAERDEFDQQAAGVARRQAGAFGEQADVAEAAFLSHVGGLRAREVRAGLYEGASGLPQIGEAGNPGVGGGLGIGANEEFGLPGNLTSSDRAPAMQAMESGQGNSYEPVLPQANPDEANGDEGDRSDDTRVAQTPKSAGYNPGNYQDAGSGNGPSGHIDSPFTRQLGRDLLGPQSDSGLQDWSDRPPTIGDHGKHLYQVQTWHHDADGNPTKQTTHEMRSGLPNAHDDVEQAAWEDHASQHNIHRDSVEVGPAMRMDSDGPKGRSAQTYTASRKGTASMQTAPCPACQGHGRVAVRTQAASGLDQIDQIADPKDNPSQTPYPTEVAFAWEMPQNSQQAIQETEQQLAEREQRKGASRHQIAERAAHVAAQQAYMRAMGGYDASGWAGDMGGGGVQPGMQDGGNPGPIDSLPYTDPVYGQGGDQGQRDLQPYGEDEANDYTNNPGMNWQPGQPTQMDMAARPNTVGQPTASLRTDDPEVQKALRFAYQRSALLSQR